MARENCTLILFLNLKPFNILVYLLTEIVDLKESILNYDKIFLNYK